MKVNVENTITAPTAKAFAPYEVLQSLPLLEEERFVVKESVVLDFIVSGIFFAMFISAAFIGGESFIMSLFVLGPAIGFFVKGVQNNETLSVDCNGIYLNKKLVTRWQNFINAYFSEQAISGAITDNFVLQLLYYKDGIEGNFRMTIPLTSTQNKSGEEILEAIRRFYTLWKEGVIPLKQPLTLNK